MIEKTISILGCGWLGLPVAKALLAKGYQVKGSTTTPEKLPQLGQAGIQPFLINLQQPKQPETIQDFVRDSDWLLVLVPPKIRSGEGENYPKMLHNFITGLKKNSSLKVIFISSTSAYPDLNKVITEEDTPTDLTGNYILQAEKGMQDFFGDNLTILRFAGLMGPGREPGKFLAGKTNVPNGNAPVNMIHAEDCIGLIAKIMEQDCLGEIFNASADEHPTRKDFFTKAALKLGLVPPVFADEPVTSYKEISNHKLMQVLGYQFVYPDPLQAI